MKKIPAFILLFALVVTVSSCKKSTEEVDTPDLATYFPLTTGKYVTYALDSLVFINFGAASEIRSYEVKYEVDAEITDNLGRPAHRIYRYIRKTSADQWQPDATFVAVNAATGLEFIEDNMRFVKLRLPIREGYSWKGNTFIDTYSLNSPVKYLDDWDYMYENVGASEQIGNFTFENTITVNHRDETIGNPQDPDSYAEVNYSQEKYAKGIGMIYRNFLHTEYQPPVPGLGGHFVDGSYGVTYTMIDHN